MTTTRPLRRWAAPFLIAGLSLTGAACAEQEPGTLASILGPSVTSTSVATTRLQAEGRRFSDADFPMDAARFDAFRRDVVVALERGLDLSSWTFRAPGGPATPAEERFRDRTLATIERHGVRMEVHAIEIVGSGVRVPVVLCLPRGSGRAPGILVLSGHSLHGLDDLIFDLDGYQRGIATRLAQAGFVAAAVEKVDSGYLAHAFDGGSDEDYVSSLLLGLGTTTRALQLKAALAALSILAAHPRVDGSRLGATGVSLGGWLATEAALLDDRIEAVADFGRKTLTIDPGGAPPAAIDPCHVLPGFLALGDRNLFLLAYAPRPLLAGHGRADAQSAREGPAHFERPLAAQYEALGLGTRLEYLVHDGGDVMPDGAVVDYFRRVLRAPGLTRR